jgi:hypothetical protein
MLLQRAQEFQDLLLGVGVKAGYRLIADKIIGMHRQGPCNHDPLALPPGKFMGIASGCCNLKGDPFKEAPYPPVFLLSRQTLVVIQWFCQGLVDGPPGVEGTARILKDDLYLPVKFPQGGITPKTSLPGNSIKFHHTTVAPFQTTEQPGQG